MGISTCCREETTIKRLLPLLILLLGAAVIWYLMSTRPEVKRHPKKHRTPVVEVVTLQPTDYPIRIASQGTVEPHTQTTLVAEVRGKVTSIADGFRAGGFFDRGDVLIRIDDRDYRNALTIAEADLAKAKVALDQEQARAEQARLDWERLGGGEPPSDLVLRKPQLASARAAVAAAEARLAQARLDLERTRLKAPYAGRVLEKQADIGQFVTPGTPLGTIYAIDYLEVELPLSERDLAELNLPLARPGRAELPAGPAVSLQSGGVSWNGRIVRATGAVDTRTRQQYVVARVDDPYGGKGPPLQLGQFVTAEIAGRKLENVFVLPRAAVGPGNRIAIVDDGGKLRRLTIAPVWESRNEVVVAEGLSPGMRLVTSPASFLPDGTEVEIVRPEESP